MNELDGTGEAPLAEGPSFPVLARACGVLCFFVINPLFIWMWFAKPHLRKWPVDGVQVFLAVVTLGMLALGCFGLFMAVARTRIYAGHIEWGLRRHFRWVDLADIDSIGGAMPLRFTDMGIPLCEVWLLRGVRKNGRKFEIPASSRTVAECFEELMMKYPRH